MNELSKRLPECADAIAPDGSEVRILLRSEGGSMAHFRLAPGQTSRAVKHRTVVELWYFLSGTGEFWHSYEGNTTLTPVREGVCVHIPTGAAFQFRNSGDVPLTAVAVTIPPWPGDGEAVLVDGKWNTKLE